MVCCSYKHRHFKNTKLLKGNYHVIDIFTSEDIYVIYNGWEVGSGKIFCRGLKNGLRPKAEGRFLDRDKIFFQYGPT